MAKKILRMTNQREVILEELRSCQEHLSADELYERVKERLPRISLATVYRNLEVLSEAGEIAKLEISGRQKRFDPETRPHDHVYCVLCHRVDNIESTHGDLARVLRENDRGYLIQGCRVEFSGICPRCRQRQNNDQ